MKTNEAIYMEFGLMGKVFKWADEHPRMSNVLLWLMGLAVAWVVFTYEFTIPAYR